LARTECRGRFSLAEAAAVFAGSGSNQPKGMTHTTPVSTADFASPLRAATAYQFVPCLTSLSPAVAEVRMDPLIDLFYTVNARYRAGAVWAMNSLTAGAVRKIKNAQGDYIWQPSSIAGQPDMLLGHPVMIWESMDDVGTNKLPIAFGNFKRAYTLADIGGSGGMKITVDEVTAPDFTKFYVRKRVGGIPTNNDAVKFLKTTIA
jgi:HK97 family phage major capsid protein